MLKVLIVDDIDAWRVQNFKLANSFLGNNIRVTVASSATEAYNLVIENQETPFDVILSDLQMELDYEPEHAGEWFVRETKLLKPYQNCLIILISASSDIEVIAQKLDVEYVPKPALVYNPLTLKYLFEEKGYTS